MQKQQSRSNMLQIGIVLTVLGLAIELLLHLGFVLNPLAHIAVAAGIILIILGLVLPRG